MLNNPSGLSTGNYYSIDFDSTLGRSVSEYVDKCNAANAAADTFVRSMHKQYRFPEIADEDILHFSDDCDAGGLLYISISNERLASLQDTPDYVMWASVDDPADDTRTIWFPRIEMSAGYMRLGEAVKIARSGRTDWEFLKDDKSKQYDIKSFLYGDVYRRISPSNRKLLLDERGHEPSHSTRLALGRHFYLATDDGNSTFEASEEYFQKALSLFKAWNDLPRVPANTLSRILRLQLPQNVGRTAHGDGKQLTDELMALSFCRWQSDAEHSRYIIHTGLVSELSGMRRIEHP